MTEVQRQAEAVVALYTKLQFGPVCWNDVENTNAAIELTETGRAVVFSRAGRVYLRLAPSAQVVGVPR